MINFHSKDQNWADDETIYWFDVDGSLYGVTDCCGVLNLVDEDGYPATENDKIRFKLLDLLPLSRLYTEH